VTSLASARHQAIQVQDLWQSTQMQGSFAGTHPIVFHGLAVYQLHEQGNLICTTCEPFFALGFQFANACDDRETILLFGVLINVLL
jgi:hypothetical protein